MQLLVRISVLSLAIFLPSCSPTETRREDAAGDFSWVEEAQNNLEKSEKETERQLALIRPKIAGLDSFARNETWELYRIEEQVYGVRTEAGKVTGELIADDAKIVGPSVRFTGPIRTSGDGFKILKPTSKDYADLQ